MASRRGFLCSSNKLNCRPPPAPPPAGDIFTVSIIRFGSMRSCTCRLTVGTSKLVCSDLPAHCNCGSRCGSYWYFFFFCPPLSVRASTKPTGGLLSRCLSLWSYCSMGFWEVSVFRFLAIVSPGKIIQFHIYLQAIPFKSPLKKGDSGGCVFLSYFTTP